MGGHVLRVWRGWSDFGISPGRLETFLGNGRIVVEMDEVMGDARMPRLALENRLEDGCAFELVGIGLVIGRGRDVQRDSVADLGFIIRRIPLRQGLHRLQISLHARPMRGLVVIGIEHGESIDEIALALRLGTDGLPLLDGSEALREIARGRRCVRIVEQTQSDPPVGDGAVGVGFEDLLEQFLRFPIPERMLVSHPRSNRRCAVSLQEVAKWTVPNRWSVSSWALAGACQTPIAINPIVAVNNVLIMVRLD